MTPSLVILVPVLKRPHRIVPTIASVQGTVPHARLLFIPDPTDRAELLALRDAGADYLEVAGNYAVKINAGAAASTEELIFLGADDLSFHDGWYEAALIARARAAAGTPLALPPVVGTNDLGNERVVAGEHATHCLVHRSYVETGTVDEPGKLLHEGYPHEFVDDEFVETAKMRGAYVHAHDAIVEHLHPLWGKAPMDQLYAAQRGRMRIGRRVYLARRHLWAT